MTNKTAAVVPLRNDKNAQLICVECHAVGFASCNCDAPYLPPFKLAIHAIEKDPNKSDRAIADEIGVNQSTVSRARKQSGDANASPETRTGKDGKTYKAKKKKKPPNDTKRAQDFGRQASKFTSHFTENFYDWLDRKPTLPAEALRSLVSIFNVTAAQFTALAEAAGKKAEG